VSTEESPEPEQPESAAAPPTYRCRKGHVTVAPMVVTLRLPTTMEKLQMVGCPQCVVDFFEDKFGVRRWTETPPKS
jgi:hypothetical protein